MSRAVFAAVAVVVVASILAGCAGPGADFGSAGDSGGPQVTGDQNGGRIPRSIGTANQSAAYEVVTAHCEKFGKTGFITKMDYESGMLTFECRQRRGKPTG